VYNIKDSIVALATTPGQSALNVVRCSGSNCLELYRILTKSSGRPRPNHAHLKTLYYNEKIIDQMMITYFRGPKSFTGEDVIEFSLHGGMVLIKHFISILESLSFRQAMPGEFSYRAFINGKIDLLQAEAINSLINSNNQLDALYSLNNLKGGLSKLVNSSINSLESLIVYIEHELDFDENEIDFIKIEKHIEAAHQIEKKINTVLKSSFLTNEKKSNVNIVFAGKTNVGKSSLFNKIVGYERSIVANKKGTTRDTVEIETTIDSFPVTLIDTAGIRETKEVIEKKGISRTHDAIKKAAIILFVDDTSPIGAAKKYSQHINSSNTLFIQNKIDINKKDKNKKTLFVSAKKNVGIDRLFTSLSTLINKKREQFISNNLYLINSRQRSLLLSCAQELKKAQSLARQTKDLVVFISGLRSAYGQIEALIRDHDKQKILNNIFGDFCVGK
tara:strand:+ start:72 stop:1409 length:1338 start_codon:yes stop_codon:yes gene_type:complete